MKSIYFIRHGKPEFPTSDSYCIGKTDLPLSDIGKIHAALLAPAVAELDIKQAYSSALLRAKETLEILGIEGGNLGELNEADFGEWDGLNFEQIKGSYPSLYAQRGEDPTLMPPGAEQYFDLKMRATSIFERIEKSANGNVLIVGHRSFFQALFCELFGLKPSEAAKLSIPHGSISRIEINGNIIEPDYIGKVVRPELDEACCLSILSALGLPENIINHSIAVAHFAMDIVAALAAVGVFFDENIIFAAAMLHDMKRTEPLHALRAFELLNELGYNEAAELIKVHHDISEAEEITPAGVLRVADACVLSAKKVSLNKRYMESRKKCKTDEALIMHTLRYESAVREAELINKALGKSFIEI